MCQYKVRDEETVYNDAGIPIFQVRVRTDWNSALGGHDPCRQTKNPSDGLCSLATPQPPHHDFHHPNQQLDLLPYAILGGGCSGIVYLVPPDRVAKCPNAGSISRGEVEHERRVYETLGTHPRILRFLGPLEEIGHLSFEHHARGTLRRVLMHEQLAECEPLNREKWARQLIQGIVYIHSRDVVHGDVSAANVLITREDELVFCDFAGSVLRGERRHLGGCELRCSRPGKDVKSPPGVQDDLFALGSVLYELYTGSRPYEGVADDEVVRLYCQGVFPVTKHVPIGGVVLSCWTGGYGSGAAVLLALEEAVAIQGRKLQPGHISLNPMEGASIRSG